MSRDGGCLFCLKGPEPDSISTRELEAELHCANRRDPLRANAVGDAAAVRVAQPDGPAQSHGA